MSTKPTEFPWYCEEFDRWLENEQLYAIYMNEPLIVNGKEMPYDRDVYINVWRDEMTQNPEDQLRLTHACRHLGEVIGEADCTCPAAPRPTEIRTCALHGRCALMGVREEGTRNCRDKRSCSDFVVSDRRLKIDHARNSYDVLTPTPENGCRLTVGAAVADGEEYSAIWATFNALNIYHRKVLDETNAEFLLVDCGSNSEIGRTSKRWIESKFRRGNERFGRYIAWDGPAGTAQPRQAVFDNARGEYVICMDPHVMFDPGALEALMKYLTGKAGEHDLIVGPQVDDNGHVSALQREEWAAGALGIWTGDERANNPSNPPFPVFQQGMGAFACRRESFVGFHPDFRGFGGCETYIMEKTRMAGGEVTCLPSFRWRHRYQHPFPFRDPRPRDQTFRNYLTGFIELGRTDWVEQAVDHYVEKGLLSAEKTNQILSECLQKYAPQGDPYAGLTLAVPSM